MTEETSGEMSGEVSGEVSVRPAGELFGERAVEQRAMVDSAPLVLLQALLFDAADGVKVAEDFLRNLLGASGSDARARTGQRRSSRWRGWSDRERISSTAVVGGDQWRRARLALETYVEQLAPLLSAEPPQRLATAWADLVGALSANHIEAGEFADRQFDVPRSVRGALVGSLLRRVLATGAAIEKARIRLMLEASRMGRQP